jgi:mannose-6-phosphate isomerase-like protein (cupin superfamily)
MAEAAVKIAPIVVNEADIAPDGWDDPTHGRLRWRTLFSQGVTPTEAITCGVAELGPGDRLKPHRHAPAEIYYIVAGEGVVFLDGKEILAKAGAAVFIPAMAEHGIRQTGAATLRFFYAFAVDSFDSVEYLFPAPPGGAADR